MPLFLYSSRSLQGFNILLFEKHCVFFLPCIYVEPPNKETLFLDPNFPLTHLPL